MKHLSEYTQLLSTTAGKTPHLLTHWCHGDIVPFHPHLCSGCRSACREGAGWEVRIMFGDCYVLMVRGTSPPVTCHLCSEARSFSWAEIRQKQDFLWLKTAEGGIDWRFGCPLRCMTFSARLICDADVKLHISRQRSSDGEGHSFYQALVRTVYGSHVTPVSPIWKIQLNRESFYCCWGGSRWEDGQMRRVISVTGTVSCDSRGWESNLQNEPKTVRILMTDWNLAPIC